MTLEYVIGIVVSFLHYGLFDLRASLAREVLALHSREAVKGFALREIYRSNFAGAQSRERL